MLLTSLVPALEWKLGLIGLSKCRLCGGSVFVERHGFRVDTVWRAMRDPGICKLLGNLTKAALLKCLLGFFQRHGIVLGFESPKGEPQSGGVLSSLLLRRKE